MQKIAAAAVYARMSSDPTGQGLGVERQLEDCRRLAEERGWSVAEEYVDNDISAYSGKRRPSYERMVADLESGHRDAVIVYNMDRLTRRPLELEQLVALCDRVGVTTLATVVGDFNLGNDQGLFGARIMSAVAAQSSARTSARLKRSNEQRAARGLVGAGGLRAFGWERDGVSEVAAEVQIIRQLVARYLAGESIYALANWLNDEGVLTTTGVPWRSTSLRNVLVNPRLAGLRAHNGRVVGKAVWKPIISEDDHHRILAIVAARARLGARSPRVSLLAGVLRCGRCGGKLTTARKAGVRSYACQRAAGEAHCGGLAIEADDVDQVIVEAVLTRLDSSQLQAALAGQVADDAEAIELRRGLESDQERMEELAALWSAREISTAEWKAARQPLEMAIRTAERRIQATSGRPDLARLAGQGSALRAEWPTMNLTRQAAIVRAVIDTITIQPAAHRGSRDILPRIVPHWLA